MNRRVLLIMCLGCMFFGCRTKKNVVTKHSKTTDSKDAMVSNVKAYTSKTEKYINTYKEIAKNEMSLYGIPASITLAQGVLESGSGKGRLSVEANNHFGIKCHDWTGEKVYHDDDKKQECFRKYKHAKYSFRDHSLFLSKRKRYAKLFKLKKEDYKGWSKGLKAAGYATDVKYPVKLINLIERYELYRFDREVLGGSDTKNASPITGRKEDEDIKISNISTHIVAKGDTMYSIARKYNITVGNLKTINSLSNTALRVGQELRVKKRLFEYVREDVKNREVSKETRHIVAKGDTLYSISKKYNMTVNELQNINGLSNLVLSVGQELRVKSTSK